MGIAALCLAGRRARRRAIRPDGLLSEGRDAVEYARALTLMEERRIAPALALSVNSAPLAARVLRLLGLEEIRGGLRGAGLATGFLCLAGALVAGNAFWGSQEHPSGCQRLQTNRLRSTTPPALPHRRL